MMGESSIEDSNLKCKDFICGVVEGFYGRPWTTEQRKDLFQKLKKWGMNMYVYAPKDDYKHRAYWREMYTVEEAEHLTSLITAAREQGVTFCYALSPGLDITYSNQKEITTLKRKLEQVSQFGCTCFALLFDDIEPEMSEADKQIFQSFAHAQVSISNEVHQHLGCPRFLVCPTQYCATRAVPAVTTSEYLNTLGTKLSHQIDIMWTGPKVISKTLTTECIEEITQVLRRPPVIWDNLHANDYDQKRIFLGPYCGRSPELIPLLRGVLTNPNCEYNANMIAIRTLAHWASCTLDAPTHMEAVSWDIKLERESEQGVCEDEPALPLNKNVYHHRQALRHAIEEWLPEFSIPKTAQGPVIKPQPPISVPPVPIIPIVPSVNTCMSLGSVTATAGGDSVARMPAIPTVTASRLRALADAPPPSAHTISPLETVNIVPNPVMNSLVSPTKVIFNESIPNPIIPMASNLALPSEIPVSTVPMPILGLKPVEKDTDQVMTEKPDDTLANDSVIEGDSFFEDMRKKGDEGDQIVVDDSKGDEKHMNGDMSVGGTPQTMSPVQVAATEPVIESLEVDPPSVAATDPDVVMQDGMSEVSSMQVEPGNSPLCGDMIIEPVDVVESIDEPAEEPIIDPDALTTDDLVLLCDLFYLPFEHGSRGLRLLHDFNWLLLHATSILPKASKAESSEWVRRRARFAWWCARARRVARRVARARNGELAVELRPYTSDLCSVLALLDGLLRWLELGKFSANISNYMQGSYTWFSKGWREAFESGAQEPWVFRGGLAADLRRLLPVEGSPLPQPPLTQHQDAPAPPRVYTHADERQVCNVCNKCYRESGHGSDMPQDLQDLPSDRLVMPFLTLYPEYCLVVEDDEDCLTDQDLEGDDENGHETTQECVNGVIKPKLVGYVCAALDCEEFYRRQQVSWTPEMCIKYPKEILSREDLCPAAKEWIESWHGGAAEVDDGVAERVRRAHPSLVAVSGGGPAVARALTCLLAALRASGASGVHTFVNIADQGRHQLFARLGFAEVHRVDARVCLARLF